MNKTFKIVLFVVCVVIAMFGLTKYRQIAITNSTIDSTPIGSTTPAVGTFTTLQAPSGISASPIGLTSPNSGAFTTLSASSTSTLATVNATTVNVSGNTAMNGDIRFGGLTNSSGFQAMRRTSCTTPASLGGNCNVTLTWPVSFGDTNYTYTCYMVNASGDLVMIDSSRQLSATQIEVTTINTPGNSTATSGTINCIGVHDAI